VVRAPRGGGALAVPDGTDSAETRATEYLDVGYVASALTAAGWSVARHVEMLTKFADDETLSNKDRREAAAEIRRIVMRSLELSGYTTKLVRRAETILDVAPGQAPIQLTHEQSQYTRAGTPGVLAALEDLEEGDPNAE
jgi:hypothetical protein